MLIQTSHLHLVTATELPATAILWCSFGGLEEQWACTSVCHKDEGETAHTPAPSSHTHDERLDWWWELYQKGSKINNPSATGDGKRKTYTVYVPYNFVSPTAHFTRVDCLLEPVRMSVIFWWIQRLVRCSYCDRGRLLYSKLSLCRWGEIFWAILVYKDIISRRI